MLLAVIVTAAYLLGREDAVAEPELDPRIVEIIEDESLGSPLNFLLGIEEGQVDFAAMEARAQTVIAECMAEKGFVYIPMVDFVQDHTSEPDAPHRPPLEQVELDGYGIVAGIERDWARITRSGGPQDPNAEIRRALSPQELLEYERALNGITTLEFQEFQAGETPHGDANGKGKSVSKYLELVADGCLYRAYAIDANAPSPLASDFILSDAFTELHYAIQADPEVIELEQRWADCMQAQGYDYGSHQDITADIQIQIADVMSNSITDIVGLPESNTVRDLEKIKNWEIEVAIVDWECSEGIPETISRIAAAYEIRFIRDHEPLVLAILEDRARVVADDS